MFNRILLASDGSDHAVRAARYAVQLADLEKRAEITVVYAVDGSTSKADVLKEGNPLERRIDRLHTTENVLKEGKVSYDVQIVKGDPGPAIVKFTNEHQFDVVVIGSRGLNGLQEMVLGSVSHKVAKRANCPVLIVK